MYKSFVRPRLDYGGILYDKPNNEDFQNELEKVQHRACLAITGAIKVLHEKTLWWTGFKFPNEKKLMQ